MEKIFFNDISSEDKSMINTIYDPIIRNIYSNFSFVSFHREITDEDDKNQDQFKFYFINYFKNIKFITYYVIIQKNADNKNAKFIVCLEGKCLIIKQMKIEIISDILNCLSIQNKSMINCSNCIEEIDDEIKSFCSYFQKDIKSNAFVRDTIKPIVCFLIRRYFYPTDYFIDKSFFSYGKYIIKYTQNIMQEIADILLSEDNSFNYQKKLDYFDFNVDILMNNTNFYETQNKFIEIIEKLTTMDNALEYAIDEIDEFKETDFIILRCLHSNGRALYFLVIHLKSLYIFMMKKILNEDDFKHEIEFCKRYSHLCINKFYGFVKEGKKIVGLIYEFMSNGSLSKYYSNHKNQISELHSFLTIMRIYQALNYFHNRSFIYQDLKPSNILLDHDYIPFISDLESVRLLKDATSANTLTLDFGSDLYMAPEKYRGGSISFSSDIYSFGVTIYFLFEKNDLIFTNGTNINLLLPQISINIQNIFRKCIQHFPSKRPTNQEIRFNIVQEINSFNYFEKYLLNDIKEIKKSIMIQFIFDSMMINLKKFDDTKPLLDNLSYFQPILFSKFKEDKGSFLFKLGNCYSNLCSTKCDYAKAKYYFELSAKYNNLDALLKLGYLFENGFGVEQDFTKAKEYYELSKKQNIYSYFNMKGDEYYIMNAKKQDYSKAIKYYEIAAKKNNPNSFYNLGRIYYYGHGVKKDYIIARKYFELSMKYNKPNASLFLGDIYENGYGVRKDYMKAKEYYELSAKLYNVSAINKLGYLYYNGYGVDQNYFIAKRYFEVAASKNDSTGFLYLGFMYENGLGVKQNFSKAREYYELSAQQNNSTAFVFLGDIYYYGCGVKQDYLKALKSYEQSAKQNNSHALNKIGYIYEKGHGVERDFPRAKKYYELSSKKDNSSALNNLGYIYENGYGIERDYLRAKQYYEYSAKQNNSTALINLGYLYENGYGLKKDYLMAKKYYKLAGKKFNSDAFVKIGWLYKKGYGVNQNYLKAKKYYEKAVRFFNSYGFLEIGNLYRKGHGVKQNFQKAKEYYLLSSQLNNPYSFFYLGCFYLNGDICDIDIEKAISYFKKCTSIHYDENSSYDLRKENTSFYTKYNKFFYPSFNDLGLIYIIYHNDIEKSTENIKISAFAEYPYAQNNFGLINELYLNNIENAVYMYERSSKHNFALAEYNLGHFYYKNGKIQTGINYYIKASEDEETPLEFHNHYFHDKRLEISKTFIICFTNLKLVEYYFDQNNYVESRKYFIKAFSKIKMQAKDSEYQFRCQFNKNLFSYLKCFIFNFPLFNLFNQPNINLCLDIIKLQLELKDNFIGNKTKFHNRDTHNTLDKIKNNNLSDKNKINGNCKEHMIVYKNVILKEKENIKQNTSFSNTESLVFDDEGKLFDFILNNPKFKNDFSIEIKKIVNEMEKILYNPPYNILFGRINIAKPKLMKNADIHLKNIDKSFYDGLEKCTDG